MFEFSKYWLTEAMQNLFSNGRDEDNLWFWLIYQVHWNWIVLKNLMRLGKLIKVIYDSILPLKPLKWLFSKKEWGNKLNFQTQPPSKTYVIDYNNYK